jgi:ABC-type nitrate/sulfonate/bicarbonate transport system ATPase subunit
MNVCDVQVDSKQFGDDLVLKEVRFAITAGSFIALVGPSGAGKSTLLNIVSGLDNHFTGRLNWTAGRPGRIGYVFQEPRLMPWLSARRNIELVLPDPAAASDKVDYLLERVGLAERGDAFPDELSGGMQRRVALARAMAIDPDVLLLDEPFSSLDEPTAESLHQLLVGLWQEQANAVLLVTHNLREAVTLADRVLFLSLDPARIVHEEQLVYSEADRREARDPDALMCSLLARHPKILSGIANREEA